MSAPTTPQLHWPYGPAQIRVIPGFANALAVPSVQILLASPHPKPEAVDAAQQGLSGLVEALRLPMVGAYKASESATPETHLREWVQRVVLGLGRWAPLLSQHVAGSPQWDYHPDLFRQRAQPVGGYVLLCPSDFPEILAEVLRLSLSHWHQLTQELEPELRARRMADVEKQWKLLEVALPKSLPAGANPVRLLSAARALDYPIVWLNGDVLQVGHGHRARLLRSTQTDATPALGVMLARDKVRTNRLLLQAGIPVPTHIEVGRADAAVWAAKRLGWPVVVKPADLDRGEGARANLQTPEQVIAAFEHASSLTERVLVEKHINGQEYRLTVVKGKLFWAHERVAAMVVGDGENSLEDLIALENAQRHQALSSNPNALKPIVLVPDDGAYLQENGWSLQAIPPKGVAVRLQRVPVAHMGGTGRAYFDTVHADNRLLAERAAQLLRLDIAGVDLITPDITRSWREVGGAITEVNAVPQVSTLTNPTLLQRLLRKMMPHSGRIPLLCVIAQGDAPAWVTQVLEPLNEAGLRVGVSTQAGFQIGQDWIRGPRTSQWDDVRALQIDPSVDAIVVVGSGTDWLKSGLPFDRVDALVVAADQPQVLSLLLPYAGGFKALIGQALQQRYADTLKTKQGAWSVWPDEPQPVDIDPIVEVLLSAEAAYAKDVDMEVTEQ